MNPFKTLFCGTGDIAIPAFHALVERSDVHLLGMITQPDKPVGRKQLLTPPKLKEAALAKGLPVWQPEKFRFFADELEAMKPDLIIVMAYGQILSKRVLAIPSIACLNLHASLLPKYRGAAPIQAAIDAGDVETGVTVIYMDVGLDTGDILLMETTPIAPDETGGRLHDRLADIAAQAMIRALDELVAGTAPRIPQDNGLATHVGKLEREHGRLDFRLAAETVERRIRAFDPWPGTFTHLPEALGGKILKVYPPIRVVRDEFAKPSSAAPGTIVHIGSESLFIATGDGELEVREVQLEGRARMPVKTFLNGTKLQSGMQLL